MTTTYPIWISRRERQYMSSKALSNCCLRAVSVARYSFQLRVASMCSSSNRSICGPVAPVGIMGVGTGLMGAMKAVAVRFRYTYGVTVRDRRQSCPFPRLEWTDAALVLSCRLVSAMVENVGMPITGLIVGCGNPPTMQSTESGMLRCKWVSGMYAKKQKSTNNCQ